MNILITGITGFFGRNFVGYLRDKNPACSIVGTAHSEQKLAHFKKNYPNIKVYLIELSSDKLETEFEPIVTTHDINYIIHAAAMKHVDICQENLIMALRVNVIAVDTIIKIAKRNGIKNLIGLSTDKSNNPKNIYGMTKHLMQQNILANGYSVYQGANFFWSDGSVVDIWFNQYIRNKPLTIRNPNHVRFFNTIDHVCDVVYRHIDSSGAIILPEHVFVICLKDLFAAFKKYFSYEPSVNLELYDFEKDIEELNERMTTKINLGPDDMIKLIETTHKNYVF